MTFDQIDFIFFGTNEYLRVYVENYWYQCNGTSTVYSNVLLVFENI